MKEKELDSLTSKHLEKLSPVTKMKLAYLKTQKQKASQKEKERLS
jgi:hypothetical protein